MESINQAAQERDEAFISLQIQAPSIKATHKLRLKIDTGAQGNTLPIRTYRQIYGDTPVRDVLTPAPHTRLTQYNGQAIKCLGTLTIKCTFNDSNFILPCSTLWMYPDQLLHVYPHANPWILWQSTVTQLRKLRKTQLNVKIYHLQSQICLPRPVWQNWQLQGFCQVTREAFHKTLHGKQAYIWKTESKNWHRWKPPV